MAKRVLTRIEERLRGLFTGRGAAHRHAPSVANRYGQLSPDSNSGERRLSDLSCRWLFDIVIVDEGTCGRRPWVRQLLRSEEHTSELQSLMRISYAVFCLKKKTHNN